MIRKLAAYVILGINTEGKKEVLTISVGDNESAKYWLSVMNELKNRGVKDVLIICADGLTGIKEAILNFSKDGIPALYCTWVRKHVEICRIKTEKPLLRIEKPFIRPQMKRKLWRP